MVLFDDGVRLGDIRIRMYANTDDIHSINVCDSS